MAQRLSGKLKSATDEQPSFAGCRIEALFDRKPAGDPGGRLTIRPARFELAETAEPEALAMGAERESVAAAIGSAASVEQPAPSAISDVAGNFTLTLPDPKEIASEKVKIEVFSPIGVPIGEKEVASEDLGKSVTVNVRKFGTLLEKPEEPPAQATRRIQGRVIERNGRQLPATLQVLLLAREEGSDDGDPLAPILVAKADASGYFVGSIQNLKFDQVVAVVSGFPGEIPVHLVESLIPPRVPIVVELPEAPKGSVPTPPKDCDCDALAVPRTPTQENIADAPGTFSADLGTGQCIRFNVPNRAIEEFNFYSVVRTTEPEIVGMTAGVVEDEPVRRPGTPPGSGSGSGGLPPAPPPAGVSAEAIEKAIRPALVSLLLQRIAASDFSPWSQVEGLIRAAVVNAGGVPLPAAFFNQFPGWGTGIVWGIGGAGVGAILSPAAGADPRLEEVIKKAAAAGAGGGTSAEVIEKAIRPALVSLLLQRIAASDFSPWSQVEGLIRAAVVNAGGVPLPAAFFNQFPGWGTGIVWGIGGAGVGAILSPAAGADPRLEEVIKKAAAAGARGGTPPPGVAYVAQPMTASPAASAHGMKLNRLGDIYATRGLKRPPRRVPLDRQAPVDWDSTPTFYEAASIAHGHLLHFKQVWYADGYSLGDLLYSLPLAPGQKKLISVVDWERREQAAREEFTSAEEGLQAALSRDRDLSEVVTGTLSESARGGSHNKTVGVGFGKGSAVSGSYQGFNFGGVMGVSGGMGESDSSAFQDASRNLGSSTLQTLRDRTLQSASAVRNLRSTIVQTARQGEAVRATTEVVANHNHCHALTIQYFEVLRHLKVTHELVDVQECLFVPFPMTEFNREKVLRWRQSVSTYLQRSELAPAFDATRRVQTDWSEVDTPAARYADELVSAIFGELTLTILIPLPPFPEKPKPKPEDTAADTAAAVGKALNPTEGFFGAVLAVATGGASLLAGAAIGATTDAVKATTQGARAMAESLFSEPSAEERYARFQQEVMPAAAVGFVDLLELYALVGANEVKLNGADFTLVSNYQPGTPLLVSVRGRITNPVRRADISAIVIKSLAPLPPGCRAIVNSAELRYQTGLFRHDLVSDQRVNDDIDLPMVAYTGEPSAPAPPVPLPPGFPTNWIRTPGMTPLRAGDGAILYTPLDEWEQRSPRLEDIRLSAELVEHLNANLEYYHHAIWWTMDPNRRFMLLDGYVAPNAGGRSVASVVDNTLIGIIGNSLIMPVALGNHLDPQFKLAKGVTLLEHYDPQSPAPPSRVSLPTRGVFAEAAMGDCNACEKIDDSRFWRWEESPIDEPPALDAAAIASRRAEPSYGTPTPFPAPIVSIQNAPQAPDPAGVKAALDTLAKQSFTDITGLAGTQANAAAAFAKAMDTALAFGKEASTLAQQAAMVKSKDKVLDTIDKAKHEGKISDEDEKEHYNNVIDRMTMTPPPLVEATGDPSEWEPWPGETKTPPKPKKPTPTSNTEDVVEVKLKLRAFVPAAVWIPEISSTFAFNGDNRTFFHPTNGTSRAEAEVSLRIDRKQFKVLEKNIGQPVFGPAETYLRLNTSPVGGGKPFWWCQKSDPANKSLVGPRTLDNKDGLLVQVNPQTSSIEIAFKLQAKPYFPYTLPDLQDLKANAGANVFVELFWPDMDADIVVRIINNGNGSLIYTVTGQHDTFPSYELYVNGEAAYTHDSSSVSVPDSAMRFPQKTIVPDPIFRPLKVT